MSATRSTTQDQPTQTQTSHLQANLNAYPSSNPSSAQGGKSHESLPEILERIKQKADDKLNETRENMNDPPDVQGPISSEDQALSFSKYAASCQSDYQSSGSADLLERAIMYQRQALLLIEKGHKMEPELLGTLGGMLNKRFEQLGKLEDVQEAIESLSRVVQLLPESSTSRLDYLNHLGLSWWNRYQQFGERKDLDQAIDYQKQLVQLAREDHPKKPGLLNNLGNSWMDRFELDGNVSHLNEAIACQTQAIRLAPEGYVHKPALLNNIAVLISRRFMQLGELADLDKGVEYGSQAVQLTPEGHINKPTYLSTLGSLWLRRFERFGSLADIDKAIECYELASQLTPEDGAWKSARLSSIGSARLRRYEHMGDLDDLDKGIENQRQAIQLTPEGHACSPGHLNSLGLSWRRRFERLAEATDINNAIECGEKAVQLVPDGHVEKPVVLMNLGCSWSSRFERYQRPADADKAIEYQTKAVQLTPDNHINKQVYLNSLGHSWNRRFKILGDPADLDKAIKYQTQALQATCDGHPDMSRNTNNLGGSFLYRYERFGNLDDLDKAVDYFTQAGQLTPKGHRDKSEHCLNLGRAWVYRFELLGHRANLESAKEAFRDGARLLITNPDVQIRCARKWAACSIRLGLSPLEAYQESFSLIPHLVWIGLTIQRRYGTLTGISDLAAEAAAWAVSMKHYDLAIEWLEEGRSIVWNQILQLRTPFDKLVAVNLELAHRLKGIASEIEGAGSRTMATPGTSIGIQWDLEHQTRHHHHLATQWELLLAEARQLPGLRDFLRPQRVQELKKAATNGPLVIINTHFSRCDALIIVPGCEDVIHVALNTFSEAKAIECREQMVALVGCRGNGDESRGFKPHSKHASPQDQFRPLVVLWLDVVSPVLEALAITSKASYHELPLITWCATGAVSFLPLHAAGLYDGISPNAFDLIVSSYTPILSILLNRGTQCQTTDPQTGLRILAVGQANSPGFPSLPNTIEELSIIEKHAGTIPFQKLDGPAATIEATLNGMENNNWVHLACHATQNRTDPSQSAFHLHDGGLTLATITKRAFQEKGLAFLSACQTATGDDELPDEATHLAAGMLMAGYSCVIATMWSIKDEDAPEVADVVYAELIKDGKMDHTNAARALHKAVGKLRDKVGPKAIKRWVPFVHIGA